MSYYLDLSEISLAEHKKQLETRHLIPSWRTLLDKIETQFEKLENEGIHTLTELSSSLKTTKKAKEFAQKALIPEKYILVLRREVLSHHPPPRNLINYPTLPEQFKQTLLEMGYQTSLDIFPEITTPSLRKTFSDKYNLPIEQLETLTHLVDVSRLRYVSAIFASLLVTAGADTISKIAEEQPMQLLKKIEKANQQECLFKGKFGENDILFLIQDAQLNHFQIKY